MLSFFSSSSSQPYTSDELADWMEPIEDIIDAAEEATEVSTVSAP